jgi:hypothetical protein
VGAKIIVSIILLLANLEKQLDSALKVINLPSVPAMKVTGGMMSKPFVKILMKH